MIRIAVTGAAGRMGKTNIEAIQAADGVKRGAASGEAASSLIGAEAGVLGHPTAELGEDQHDHVVGAADAFHVLHERGHALTEVGRA